MGETMAGPDIAPTHSGSIPWRLDVVTVAVSRSVELLEPCPVRVTYACINCNHHRFLKGPEWQFALISIQAGLRDGEY